MSTAKTNILGSVVVLMIVAVQPRLLASQDRWRTVVALADDIKVAGPSADRGEMARKLELLIDRRRRGKAPKEVVDKLIDLMSDEDGGVRCWVAVALGDLGPQARAAIPALERAREEDEALLRKIGGGRSGIWVMDAIEVALKKIRGETKKPPNQ